MKKYHFIILMLFGYTASGQYLNPSYPVISVGGVYNLPYAVEKPDPKLVYNIVIEVERESARPDSLNWALNNVARLINLHALGGVPKEKMNIVLAIHGGATYTLMDNEAYRTKYGVDNPNLDLVRELKDNGVKMFVCGQSLIKRDVGWRHVTPEVKIAVSMLTVLTTYQLKGYAALKF